MAAIIIGNEKKILSCFPPGPTLGKITFGSYTAISKSFAKENKAAPTHAEIKHKFDIIMGHAVYLRGDLQWGVERIVNSMDAMLEADRNGGRWEPDDRQCWIASDG